jgi:hypothetical protein
LEAAVFPPEAARLSPPSLPARGNPGDPPDDLASAQTLSDVRHLIDSAAGSIEHFDLYEKRAGR